MVAAALGRILDFVVIGVMTVIGVALGEPGAVDHVGLRRPDLAAAEIGGDAPSQDAFAMEFYKIVLPIILISIAVSLVYETAFLTIRGATPGKMVTAPGASVDGPGPLSVATALRRQIISVCTSLMSFVPCCRSSASG